MPNISIPIPKTRPDLRTISEIAISWLFEKDTEKIILPTINWKKEHWRAARWVVWAQGIGPMLYSCLKDRPVFVEFPRHFCRYLSSQYRFNGQRTSLMMDELSGILKACNEEGIQIIPLKGSVLIPRYYKDAALRPMADLDLLIKPEDKEKTHGMLCKMGYRILRESWRHRIYIISGASRKLVLEGQHPDNPRQIEIHLDLRENFFGVEYNISDIIWRNCHDGFLMGVPGRILEPWAILIHLLLHTSRHIRDHAGRFMQLMDIYLAASSMSMYDWESFLIEAEGIKRKHAFYLPFSMLSEYFKLNIPEVITGEINKNVKPGLSRFLKQKKISYFSVCNAHPVSPFEQIRWNYSDEDSLTSFKHLIYPSHGWAVCLWMMCYAMGFSRYDPFNDYFMELRNIVINRILSKLYIFR